MLKLSTTNNNYYKKNYYKKTNMILDVVKMLAINFAEWLSKNEWVKKTKTHPNKIGMYWSHKHFEYKPIEELYEMFIKEEIQRLGYKTKQK